MAEKKKNVSQKVERPKKQKDGTIKWGNKTFKNEKELTKYLDSMPIIDGAKKRK